MLCFCFVFNIKLIELSWLPASWLIISVPEQECSTHIRVKSALVRPTVNLAIMLQWKHIYLSNWYFQRIEKKSCFLHGLLLAHEWKKINSVIIYHSRLYPGNTPTVLRLLFSTALSHPRQSPDWSIFHMIR